MKKDYTDVDVLYQVIEAISSLGTKELLAKIDYIVTHITHADSTGIYILDEKTNSVVLKASKLHFDIVGKLKMKLGQGITGWVAQFGKTVVIEKDAPSDSRFVRIPQIPDDLFESFLSVPIKSNNVVVGVINVKHKLPHIYPKSQVKLLEMIGKLVGRAVEQAMLLEKTKNFEEALQTQKVVNKAKGILMEKMNLSENDAYHTLRKQAMKKGKSMKEIAEAVITSSEITG